MKLIGVISTAVLSLTLGVAAPVYAQQEQHDQKEEQKAKPEQGEKKAQPEKAAKQQQKPSAQHEQSAKAPQKNAPQAQKNIKQENTQQKHAANRIPDERYKANFGRDHRFHVSQADYSRDRRFQYGGYWFGFVDPWPSNWLYTQDVFVVEINGMYYLCNPMYPGVNIALNVTL
jgi:hypothetical protein